MRCASPDRLEREAAAQLMSAGNVWRRVCQRTCSEAFLPPKFGSQEGFSKPSSFRNLNACSRDHTQWKSDSVPLVQSAYCSSSIDAAAAYHESLRQSATHSSNTSVCEVFYELAHATLSR